MSLDKYLKSTKDFNVEIETMQQEKLDNTNDSGIHDYFNETTAYPPTNAEGDE